MQDSFIEGMPAGTAKGYKVVKIFQTQEEIDALNQKAMEAGHLWYQGYTGPGDYMIEDVNKDGTITSADRDVIVNPEPKFFGGWSNTLTYKGLSLYIMFQYSAGGQSLYSSLQNCANSILGDNVLREIYGNTWTPDNTDAKYARLVYNSGNYFNTSNNDRFVFDKSYLRLKNLTLSYSFPAKIAAKMKMSGLQVYATATNLLTLTNWPGLDPELTGNFVTTMSMNNDVYPLAKSFSIGANFKF